MANVFGTEGGQKSVFKAGNAKLTVNGQQLFAVGAQLSFQRSVTPLPTLGKGTHIAVGEPSGTFTANALLAKDADAADAFNLSSNGCAPFSMTITFTDGSCAEGSKTITANNCVASSVQMTFQAGQGYIAEGISVVFTDLDM